MIDWVEILSTHFEEVVTFLRIRMPSFQSSLISPNQITYHVYLDGIYLFILSIKLGLCEVAMRNLCLACSSDSLYAVKHRVNDPDLDRVVYLMPTRDFHFLNLPD